ncbi:MAG: HmuY family protein [Pseudomonadota bacterium]
MHRILALIVILGTTACDPAPGESDAGTDAGLQDASNGNLCDPVTAPCEDEMIQQLSLHTTVATGEVTSSEASGVFTAVIDASAGGSQGSTNYPFVYVKFTDSGAIKVAIDDETALASQDWDIAVRRYILRLNGGDSGPSCVAAAETSAQFDAVTTAPGESAFALEDFYTASCDYVTDTRFAGFDGPDTLLKEFWSMNGMCLATSGITYVLRLADGRHLKLVVDAYYRTGQDGCNTSGTAGSQSGVLTLRWAWLS